MKSGVLGTAILIMLALGTPLSWKNTLMAQINTWLGIVIDPAGPTVQMARDKHLLVMKLLENLVQSKVFTRKGIEKGFARLQRATTCCPPDQVSASAVLGLEAGKHQAPEPRQVFESSVYWFHYEVKETRWAFVQGSPKRHIAALEMLGSLVLTAFLIEKNGQEELPPRQQIQEDAIGSGPDGTNAPSSQKMKLGFLPLEARLQPQWVDELRHADYQGFNSPQWTLAPSHLKRDFNHSGGTSLDTPTTRALIRSTGFV